MPMFLPYYSKFHGYFPNNNKVLTCRQNMPKKQKCPKKKSRIRNWLFNRRYQRCYAKKYFGKGNVLTMQKRSVSTDSCLSWFDCPDEADKFVSFGNSQPSESVNGKLVGDTKTETRKQRTGQDYEVFKENLLKLQIPKYVQHTFWDSKTAKICIDIHKGHIQNCILFLQENYSTEYEERMFDIMEVGNLKLCILGDALAAKSDNSDQEGIPTETPTESEASPGQMMSFIQYGCQIKSNTAACTLGAIMVDRNKSLYGITAMHLINRQFGRHEGDVVIKGDIFNKNNSHSGLHECTLSKEFKGFIGPFSNEQAGIKKHALDITALKLECDIDTAQNIDASIKMNGNVVDICVYEDVSSNLVDRAVHMKGAKTGEIPGKVIMAGVDVYVAGEWIGNDCFLVGSETKPFAQNGDSGSLLHDEEYGYGILFSTVDEYQLRSGKTFKMAAWCTRLDTNLAALKHIWQLDLHFVPPLQDHAAVTAKENSLRNIIEMDQELQYRKLISRKHADKDIISAKSTVTDSSFHHKRTASGSILSTKNTLLQNYQECFF